MTADESRLLQRHLPALTGRLLLVNPPADDFPLRLQQAGAHVRVFHQQLAAARTLQAQGIEVEHDAWLTQAGEVDRILLWQMKSQPWHGLLLAMLQAAIDHETPLWLVGAKRTGIRGGIRRLSQHGSDVQVLDKARHCTLAQVRLQPCPGSLESHYSRCEVRVAGRELAWYSLPGVFAHGRLDAGSRMLLEHLPPKLDGRVLDYGAGAGVLAMHVQQQGLGSEWVLLEPDALARACARRNLPEARVVAGTALADVEGRFDWVVSNPPFHQGQARDLDVALQLIRQAPHRLHRGGGLLLVANRHLPYHQPLASAFARVEVLAENNHYRLYLGTVT